MKAAAHPRPESAAASQVMMQAIVQRRYGATPEDVLRLEQIARPAMDDDEVLVRVRAAGVDRGTVHLMTGTPYLMRILGFGLRAPKNAVPGWAVAGTVQALRDKARLRPGQHVLIIGASGGVGTFAVQLAKAFGAEVTGACRTGKTDLVRALGADHVLDYTREDITAGRHRYDVIIDIGGNRPLAHLRRALTPKGTLVITGGENGDALLGGIGRNLRAQLLSPFVSQKLTAFIARQRRADLVTVRDMAHSGAVTPAIDRSYPLSQAAAAVRYLADGHARGKVVIGI